MKNVFLIASLLLSLIIRAQTPNICFTTKDNSQSSGFDYLITEDLNNDTKMDVIMIRTNYNNIAVYSTNGYGGLMSTPTSTVYCYSPGKSVLSDFNEDGHKDLAVCCGDNNIRVFFGNGLGTFGSPAAFATGNGPSSVAVADFNNDGHGDLAVTNRNSQHTNILLGNGSGNFSGSTYSHLNYGFNIVTDDFNADGNVDILIASGGTTGFILSGNGLGGFVTGVPFNTGANPYAMICKDINHDNLKDLIVTGSFGIISVVLRNPTGFNAPVTISTPANSFLKIDLADLNNDGNLDIVAGDNLVMKTFILLGNGSGGFSNFSNFDAEFSSLVVGICDLNNDGNNDIIASNSAYSSIALGLGTGLFKTFPYIPTANNDTSNGMSFIHHQDVDGDSIEDVIFPDSLNSLKLLFGDGNGSFSRRSKIIIGSSYPASRFCSFDVNNDGKDDIIVTESNKVYIKLHNGTNGFVSTTLTFTVNSAIHSIECADFNGDGNGDLAVSYTNKDYLSVMNGNGTGAFGPAVNYTCATASSGSQVVLAVVDLNLDGKPDIVTANRDNNSLSRLLNNGSGAFPAASITLNTGVGHPKDVRVIDVNNDGIKDVVFLGFGIFRVFRNNGTGNLLLDFSKNVLDAFRLNVDDLNNDGNIDITTTSDGGSYNNMVKVVSRNSNGTYTNEQNFLTGEAMSAICSIDLNKDGAKDLIVGVQYETTNTLNFLFNTSAIFTPGSSTWNVCQNNTNVLKTVKGGFNYQWSPSGNWQDSVIVSGINSLYSYTVSNQNGSCISSSRTLTVTVNPSPTITVNSGSVCAGVTFTIVPTGAATFTYSGGSAVVNPAANSAYTVTGSDSNGCTGTAISLVTVNPAPTVTATNGSVCAGESFTIVPGGAITYTYSGGSGIVSPVTNSSYTVTGSGSNGCIGSAVSSVSVNPIPVIGIASTSICAGQSFIINPAGALTYTFSSGSATVIPTSNSAYTVTGTNAAGCVGSTTMSVTVNPTPTLTINSGSICSGQTFTLNPSGAATYTYSSGSSVVAPLTNTNFTVTGTGANSCTGNAISSVTVNPTPTLTINNGSICSGQIFTLNPTGAATYTYSSGSNTVSPVTTTSYTVTGTSALGCVNLTGAVSTVTVMARPTVAATTSSSLICLGSQVTLTGSGANAYAWTNGVQNNVPYTPAATTIYTVTGTSNGCSNTATVQVIVNACTGLEALSSDDNTFNIYPNPANTSVTIHSSTTLQKIELLSITGQIILTEMPSGNQHQLTLADVANGVYFIVVQDTGQKVSRKKIVVQH